MFKFLKRKRTPSQVSNILSDFALKCSVSLYEDLIEKDDLASKIKKQCDWEILYFNLSLVYIIIELSATIPRREEIIVKLIERDREIIARMVSVEDIKYFLENCLWRIKAYKMAWDVKETEGLATLLLNILFVIQAGSDEIDFIDGYIKYAKSSNKELKDYHTKSWFPSAHAFAYAMGNINTLIGCINDTFSDIELI
jgi:hypothetical protein